MRGFTLIELLVVIAILVLLTAAFPLALDRAVPARRVAATAQHLASAIRDAETDSMTRGSPVRLQIDSHGLMRAGQVAVGFPRSTDVALLDRDGRPLTELVLYPDGSATAGQFMVKERTHVRRVIVSSISGRVSVEVPL